MGDQDETGADPVDDDSERQILLAAVELVDEHGESRFRIADLVERSGRSVGLIYHFFGNREGVLEAVWMHQMAPWMAVDQQLLCELTDSISTVDDLRRAVALMVDDLHHPDRLAALWSKLEVIAAARRRPTMQRVVVEQQRRMTAAYAEMVERLQAKGVMDPALDPRAVSVFVQAFTLGRILGQFDPDDPIDEQAWADVVVAAYTSGLAVGPS